MQYNMEMELDQILLTLYHRKPMTDQLTAQIRHHSTLLGAAVAKDYTALKDIIDRHESVIRDTWKKKRRGRREKIIIDAWPTIPRKHRPDFAAALNEHTSTLKKEELSLLGPVLWPYLNLEDLSQAQPILILLNSRARNAPWTFAGSELIHSPLAFWPECISPGGCGLFNYFTRDPDPRKYGQVLSTDMLGPENDALKHCLRDGLLILKIQNRIYNFLVHFCQGLLSNIFEGSKLSLLEYPIQPEPSTIVTPLSNQNYSTMSDFNLLAPYRGRCSIEFTRLYEHALALLNGMQDHIWSLREDPSYFMGTMNLRHDHNEALIKDEYGNQCPGLRPTIESPSYRVREAVLIARGAYYDIGLLNIWLKHLGILKDSFQNGIVHNLREGFTAVHSLLWISKVISRNMIKRFLSHTRGAPGIRDFYMHPGSCCDHNDKVVQRPQRLDRNEVELTWILDLFAKTEHHSLCAKHSFTDLALALERLDSLIHTDRRIKKLVSSLIAEDVATLSVILECIRQVYAWLGHPEVNQFKKNCNDQNEDNIGFDKECEDYAAWAGILGGHESPLSSLDSMANYPIHNIPSTDNIDAMIQAEKSLDDFWKHVDDYMEEKTGVAQHKFVRQCLVGELRRTLPAVIQLDQVKAQEHIYIPLSRHLHKEEKQITGTFKKPSICEKPKQKTRGIAISTTDQKDGEDDRVHSTTPTKRFVLHKRPYQVFKTIMGMHAADPGSCPKVVKWHDFIHAMTCVGFAVEKLQGSAWQFTPGKDSDILRGIQFHEPHPDSDIPYAMARRFGSRLERVYGWDKNMFHLD